MENDTKFKTEMEKGERRKETNQKHYLKRSMKATTDSNMRKRKVEDLEEQLLLHDEEIQILRKNLEASKSTVQQLEDQIATHNTSNLPQLSTQPQVARRKKTSKTTKRAMRELVTEMQFNMYVTDTSDYLTKNGKPIGYSVRTNMNLKSKLLGKRLRYFIGETIDAEEKAKRQRARGGSRVSILWRFHTTDFWTAKELVLKEYASPPEPTVQKIWLRNIQQYVLKLTWS